MKRFVCCSSKTGWVYKLVSSLLICLLVESVSAQNIGIGITTPTRAKLETRGMVGSTLALFGGDQNGISLVANSPGIYFNSYFNSGVRSIQPGQGGNLSFDPSTGRFRFYRNSEATFPDQLVTQSFLASIESNGDIIANSFRYNSPRTFFYSVGGADFTSRDGNDVILKEVGSGGATMISGSGIRGMVAPVHLPHGATVTSVTFYYTDNSSTTDIEMSLLKYHPILSFYSLLASATSSGTPGSTNATTNTIANPTIQNTDHALFVQVTTNLMTWPNTISIRAVVIAYTVAAPD